MYYKKKFVQKRVRKAKRGGVYYPTLERWEVGYVYGMCKQFEVIRSLAAVKIIMKILAKLKEALKSPFVKAMESRGVKKAKELAERAVEWGNEKARSWAWNMKLPRYLTLLDFYKPKGCMYG